MKVKAGLGHFKKPATLHMLRRQSNEAQVPSKKNGLRIMDML